ncbi:uncharacterized protein [Choristoneura fumiferana]|uniref:uncharacterized protein n=1 Tax=Choristoneura fumiferana TaxID=7141 RepID=UPI003D15DA64
MVNEETKSATISPDERRLKAQIAQCKGSLTKAENFLRNQQEGSLDKEAINTRLQQLAGVLVSHKELSLQLHLLNEESADTDFNNDDFEDRCLAITANLRKLLHTQEPVACGGSSAIKLPDMDIPVFDGKDFTKYNTFIELFSAIIDSNTRLAPIQKLFYLRKFLKGEPLSLIEGLPITGDSYPKSLELLGNRYDNKFLVITNHVQALLDFPTISKGASSNLRELVSNSRQHLAALETLGQSPKHWDMLLLPILLRKVDQYTCRAYHSERVTKELPTLEDFFTFLERRACSFEVSQQSEDGHLWAQELQLPRNTMSAGAC